MGKQSVQTASKAGSVGPNNSSKRHVRVQTDQKLACTSNSEHWPKPVEAEIWDRDGWLVRYLRWCVHWPLFALFRCKRRVTHSDQMRGADKVESERKVSRKNMLYLLKSMTSDIRPYDPHSDSADEQSYS